MPHGMAKKKKKKQVRYKWDFSGGLVVKPLCFHCRGYGYNSQSGKFNMSHNASKKKKKKEV